jgi:hypothetical protein
MINLRVTHKIINISMKFDKMINISQVKNLKINSENRHNNINLKSQQNQNWGSL